MSAMINVNEIVQNGRSIFREKLYQQFISNTNHFRLILSIDERENINQSYNNLKIQHQLWQSIDDPWIFVLFIDYRDVLNSLDTYISNEFNENQVTEHPTILTIKDQLENIQKEKFQFVIEGDPLIFDSSIQMSPVLVDIDFFNNFYDFKQIVPLKSGIFNKDSEFYFKEIQQDPEKIPELFFYALHHPEQFISESISEAMSKLY